MDPNFYYGRRTDATSRADKNYLETIINKFELRSDDSLFAYRSALDANWKKFLTENLNLFGGDPNLVIRRAKEAGIGTHDYDSYNLNILRKIAFEESMHALEARAKRHQSFDPNKKPKIVVVAVGGGGGHKSQAEAVRDHLSNQFEVQIIEEKDLSTGIAAMTGGKHTQDSLYNSIYQQRTLPDGRKISAEEAEEWLRDIGEIEREILSRTAVDPSSKMHQALEDPQVVGLIDTSSFIELSGITERLQIPHLRMISDIGAGAYTSRDAWQGGMTQVGMVTALPKFNKGLVFGGRQMEGEFGAHHHSVGNISFEGVRSRTHRYQGLRDMEKLADYDAEGFVDALKKTPGARELGYPVRKGIKRSDQRTIKKFREQAFGMKPQDKLIAVGGGAKGKLGVEDAVKQILKGDYENLEGQIHLLVLPGTNSALKNSLKDFSKSNPNSKVILRFPYEFDSSAEIPTDLVPSPGMGRLLSASDLVIGKPGGGFTAEVREIETPFLMIEANLHAEQANIEFITESGLGRYLESSDYHSIDRQVLAELANPRKVKPGYEPLDWRANLSQWGEEALKHSTEQRVKDAKELNEANGRNAFAKKYTEEINDELTTLESLPEIASLAPWLANIETLPYEQFIAELRKASAGDDVNDLFDSVEQKDRIIKAFETLEKTDQLPLQSNGGVSLSKIAADSQGSDDNIQILKRQIKLWRTLADQKMPWRGQSKQLFP